MLYTIAEFTFLWGRGLALLDEKDANFTDKAHMINRAAHFIAASQLTLTQKRLSWAHRLVTKKKMRELEKSLVSSSLLLPVMKEVKKILGDNYIYDLLEEISRLAHFINISCPTWENDLLVIMIERQYMLNKELDGDD